VTEQGRDTADLAVVIVNTADDEWLARCLPTLPRHAGSARLDVVVIANGEDSSHGVTASFPWSRGFTSPNRGFAYANNRGIEQVDARYVLLLNPDTEILEGTFDEIVRLLDERPDVGAVGVRQVDAAGELAPTIHRFPSPMRALGDAFSSERWPVHPSSLGERVLDPEAYEREIECDWVLGAFLLLRREALMSAGVLDERFFLYCEEPDICLRIKQAGWQVRHLPHMTILHHAEKAGIRPVMVAQDAYARMQYARKHFGRVRRTLYVAALALRHLFRAIAGGTPERRAGARLSLRTIAGFAAPPLAVPPATAVAPAAPPPPTSARL